MFSGFPLFIGLKKAGKKVYLGNLSFTTDVEHITGKRFTDACIEVTADSKKPHSVDDYFPEYFLSKWFRESEKEEIPIYLFSNKFGVKQITEAYQKLVDELTIDTIILADGGTDSLMRGDESGLGTPTEDMLSICSVNQLKRVKEKLLICLGFGVDCFHGVCHHHFLENVAAISKSGGFLGSFSIIHTMEEAKKLKAAYESCQPGNSIVTSSVVSAIEGEFGNYHSSYTITRTKNSKLYISPLMSMVWTFDLTVVASRVLYLDKIKNTKTLTEVRTEIHKACKEYYDKAGLYKGPRQEQTIPY